MTEPFSNTGQGPSERDPLDVPDLFGDPDPLLETGWFIDTEAVTESMPESRPETTGTEPSTTPAPDPTNSLMVTPVSQRRSKKPVEEITEQPAWLPEGWRVEVRVRTSGATAGTSDRYFISPSGQRFRSKVEVLHYLETGSKRRNSKKSEAAPSEAPGGSPSPSTSPSDKKRKKSKSNPRDFSDLKFDFENPPESVTWVRGDDSADEWIPSTGNGIESPSVKSEWMAVYSRLTQLGKSNGSS